MQSSPLPAKQHPEPVGPFVGIIIVVLLVVLGGIYFFFAQQEKFQTPPIEDTQANS